MASSDLLTRIFSARLERAFNYEGVWQRLSRNVNMELGDALEMQLASDGTSYSLDSSITFAESHGTAAASLAYAAPGVLSGNGVTLKLDNLRSFRYLLSNTVAMGIQPDLLLEAAYQGAVETTQAIDAEIRTELASETLTSAGTAITIDTTATPAEEWGDDDHVAALVKLMREATIKANVAGWPAMGRYVVTSVPHAEVWQNYVLDKNFNFATPINDRMLEMGAIPSGYGWAVIGDPAQGSGTGTTTDANHDLYFGVMGHGIAHAFRSTGFRVFESEQYAGLLIQGQILYGAKVNLKSKFMHGDVTIS